MPKHKPKKYDDDKIMTPAGRLAFPSLFKPQQFEGQEPKYVCTLIFEDEDELKEMKKKVDAVAKEFFKGKKPKSFRSPFRDGDEMEEYEGFSGNIFVRFSSTRGVGVVDENREDVLDSGEVYPGRWARAIAVPFGYSTAGNKGVSFGLRDVQLLDHDDRLDGGGSCKDDFEAVTIKGKQGDDEEDDDGEW